VDRQHGEERELTRHVGSCARCQPTTPSTHAFKNMVSWSAQCLSRIFQFEKAAVHKASFVPCRMAPVRPRRAPKNMRVCVVPMHGYTVCCAQEWDTSRFKHTSYARPKCWSSWAGSETAGGGQATYCALVPPLAPNTAAAALKSLPNGCSKPR
jgi:hypothetical protein